MRNVPVKRKSVSITENVTNAEKSIPNPKIKDLFIAERTVNNTEIFNF